MSFLRRQRIETLEDRTLLSLNPLGNVGTDLALFYNAYETSQLAKQALDIAAVRPDFRFDGDAVMVEIRTQGGLEPLGAGLQAHQFRTVNTWADPLIVSGYLPIGALPAVAALPEVLSVLPVWELGSTDGQGAANNQAETTLRADLLRQTYDVDGTGVTIGVISDSANLVSGGIATSQASGDLPPGNRVQDLLEVWSSGTVDEGRAMMELIYDIAPGADLRFASGGATDAQFATAVNTLVAAGCDVIVDDLNGLSSEPYLQDGLAAQAVANAIAGGVSYYGSAGNRGKSGYEAPFTGMDTTVAGIAGRWNDFGGSDPTQTVTLGSGTTTFVFQYDDPFYGGSVTRNVDFYVLNAAGTAVLASGTDNNLTSGGTGVPREIVSVNVGSATTVQIAIRQTSGPSDITRIKYIGFNSPTIVDHLTEPGALNNATNPGHSSVPGAVTVAAAYWGTPTTYESFTAQGPSTRVFDAAGNRLAAVQTIIKPEVTAHDGCATTVPGFASFYGTSAAAPNAAAVGALLRQLNPAAMPAQIKAALINGATDINTPGYDFRTGYGLVDAVNAALALGATISGRMFHDLDGDGVKDPGEPGLEGWTINLDLDDDGSVDQSTTTDSSGNYAFTSLPAGTHTVFEVLQTGWVATMPDPLGTYTVMVEAAQTTTCHFANFRLVDVGGRKFSDLNGNGVRDAGEPGLAGWTINLDLNGDDTVDATTTTDANGDYTFPDVGPGTHTISEVSQAGWTQTAPAAPGTHAVTPTSGQNVTGKDFGNHETQVPEAGDLVAADVTSAGGVAYSFTVTYSDNIAVDVATLGNGDVQVSGPGGFELGASLLGVSPGGNGSPRVATYRFAPPGASWDFADNGTYTLAVVADQVKDTSGNAVAAGSLGSFTVDIAPPDSVTVEGPPAPVAEDSAGNLVYTFTRALGTVGDLTVTFTIMGTADDGTDYAVSGAGVSYFPATNTGTLVIPDGQPSASVTIAPNADNLVEATETVVLIVDTGPGYTPGTPRSATGTITNDDGSQVSILGAAVVEGDSGTTNLPFTITLSNPVDSAITVLFTTSDVTAQAATDYATQGAVLVTVPANTTTLAHNVLVSGDALVELHETLSGVLSGLNNAGRNVYFAAVTSATGTISNDDHATLSITGGFVLEGHAGTANLPFTVHLSNPVDVAVTVLFSTADGTALAPDDYSTQNYVEIAIPANATSVSHDVVVFGDSELESDETVSASIALLDAAGRNVAPGSPAPALGTILDDDSGNTPPVLSFARLETETFQGVRAQTLSFRLTATDPDDDTFDYHVDWGDGTTLDLRGASSVVVTHEFPDSASYTPWAVATDLHGRPSDPALGPALGIQAVELQGANLAVGGTTAADTLELAQVWRAGTFSVSVNALPLGTYTLGRNGRVLIFGQADTDLVALSGTASWDRFETTAAGMMLNGWEIAVRDVENWSLAGLNGVDTFAAATGSANVWSLEAADAGSVGPIGFLGMEKLLGGTATDRFQFSDTTRTYMSIDGGAGPGDEFDYSALTRAVTVNAGSSVATGAARYLNIESFVGSASRSILRAGNGTNAWTLDGPNAGTINGRAFTGFGDLVGGRGIDRFAVGPAGTANLVDGGGGADLLDFSAHAAGVTVDLAAGTADGLASVRHFRMVIGTAWADTLTAGATATTLLGGAGDDVLNGGAGRDLLIGGSGSDLLGTLAGGEDMLYGGMTAYYDEATRTLTAENLRALDMLLQSWNTPSLPFAERVAWMQTRAWFAAADWTDDHRVDMLQADATDWAMLDTGDLLNP